MQTLTPVLQLQYYVHVRTKQHAINQNYIHNEA